MTRRSEAILILAAALTLLAASPTRAGERDRPPLWVNGYAFDRTAGEFPAGARGSWARRGSGRYQLVQLQGPVRPEWKDALAAAGARLLDYVPDHAFVARIPPQRLAAVRELPFVSLVVPFGAPLRVERGLETRSGLVTVNVQLFEGEPAAEAEAAVQAKGGTVLRRAPAELQVRIPTGAVASLAAVEGVRWIEEARPIGQQNGVTSWLLQSGLTGFRPAWDRGLRGEGQIVGIGDSGLDWDHECFFDPGRPQVQYVMPGETRPPDLAHRKVVNYWVHTGDRTDSDSHGTHTSGTIACDDLYVPGHTGNPNGQGMAPLARLSFSDLARGDNWTTPMVSDVVQMFDHQYGDGARLHSDSWLELRLYRAYTSMSRAFDEYMWNHPDFLILSADGNYGQVEAPATAKNSISVGGGALSYGPTADGRVKPTLVVPPTLTSARSDNDTATFNSGYWTTSGTSMSTPATAGSVALMRQYFMEGWYPTGAPEPANAFTPSAVLLKAVLLAGASELTSGFADAKGEGVYPNNTQGWGQPSVDGSLYFAGERRKLWLANPAAGLATAERATFSFDVVDASVPLRVILAWTDYPAAFGSTVALVNDLDLRVEAPDGKVYLGNARQGLNPGHSVVGGSPDRLNVEEGVLLPSSAHGLVPGRYSVTVEGWNVPQAPQRFALAATGGLDGPPADEEPPTILTVDPPDGASGVASSRTLAVTFSEDMARSLTEAAFTIEPAVAGHFSWTGRTLVFTPTAGLAERTAYAVTLSTTAQDMVGNRMAAPRSFAFTTVGWTAPPAPQPPLVPGMPTGPGVACTETAYSYFTWSTDPNDDAVQYELEWGDGTTTLTAAVASGARVSASHTWGRAGSFALRARATDATGRTSAWGPPLAVSVSDLPSVMRTGTSGDGSAPLSSDYAESQQIQSFKVGSAVSSLRSLSLALARSGEIPSGFQLIVSLRTTLTGSDLAWGYVSAADVASTDALAPSWVRVTLNKTASLTNGSIVYLVVRTSAASGNSRYLWATNAQNPYPDGVFYEGPARTARLATDALFRVPSGTPPPNLPASVPGSVIGPASGDVGASLAFQALAHDVNFDAVRIVFDWNDGSTTTSDLVGSGSLVSAAHAWTSARSYGVRARAVDVNGNASDWGGTTSVVIGGGGGGGDTTPPQVSGVAVSSVTSTSASVSWTTDEPSSSTVEFGPTTAYGATATGADGATSHAVSLSGLTPATQYHLRVASQDAAGNRTTSGDAVFTTQPAAPLPPVAGFTATPTSGMGPLAVQFTDTSTGAVTAWAWDFGDGQTSVVASPSHTYTQAGDYTVELVATGPGGSDSERKTAWVHVTSATPAQRITLRITATNADGTVMGSAWYGTAKTAYLGRYGGQDDHAAFTFASVPLQRGARIVGAWLRVMASDTGSGECLLDVAGFAQNSAGPIASYADWQARPQTAASVAWSPELWARNSWFTSVDLAPIVQEIVDRAGWSSGAGLGLTVGPAAGNAGHRLLFQRDQGTSYGAELVIDYLP